MTPAEENMEEVFQYALRRKDTGEFFWTPKKPPYRKLPPGDPRLRHWTPHLNRAKLFHWRGIKVLASHQHCEWQNGITTDFDVEIVKCKLVIEEISSV